MVSDALDARLYELYVEEDLNQREVGDVLGREKEWVRGRLLETDWYEPETWSLLDDMESGDLGDPVEPPEPRHGGESA